MKTGMCGYATHLPEIIMLFMFISDRWQQIHTWRLPQSSRQPDFDDSETACTEISVLHISK